jgi:SWI/SNF-related matrix-associated actin-dependent regulator 1 of chromatin subfamily A
MNSIGRQQSVDRFQLEDAAKVFTATTAIASEGLTLTAADTIIYVDLPWSPGQLEQSQSRAHRKGQINPVHCYYLLSDTPFDKTVREALKWKQAITEELLDKKIS